ATSLLRCASVGWGFSSGGISFCSSFTMTFSQVLKRSAKSGSTDKRCRFTPAFVFRSPWQSKQNCLNSGSAARTKSRSAADIGFAPGLVSIEIAAAVKAAAAAKQSSDRAARDDARSRAADNKAGQREGGGVGRWAEGKSKWAPSFRPDRNRAAN